MKCSASLSIQYDNIFSPFPGAEWERGLEWVAESGFDAVEIILSDPCLLNLDAVTKKLDSLHLPVSTISTGQAMGLEGLSMTSFSRDIRQRTIQRLKDDIDFAVQLGRPHVTIGLIRGKGGAADRQVEHELLVQSLLPVVDYAAKNGIMLNLEAINRYECAHLNSSQSVLNIMKELGDPENVGILYDTFHSNIEDGDITDTIRALKGRIANVHFADSNRRLPGEGHLNFEEIVRVLNEIGYEYYVALEVLNQPDVAHIRENAGKSIRRYIK